MNSLLLVCCNAQQKGLKMIRASGAALRRICASYDDFLSKFAAFVGAPIHENAMLQCKIALAQAVRNSNIQTVGNSNIGVGAKRHLQWRRVL